MLCKILFYRNDCICWNHLGLGDVPVAENQADYENSLSTAAILGIMVFRSVRSKDAGSLGCCQEYIVGDSHEGRDCM